ncbi:MAG: DUF1330 domain-containing protein [Pseudomonadota bacterium]
MMTVYVISQISIFNREEYDLYASKFMDVFEQFNGKMLSVDDEPKVIAGHFEASRSILIEFPDKEEAYAWMTSPAYQEIAKHRDAGATLNTILVKALND